MAGKRRKPTLTSEESGAKKSKPSETMWSSSSGTGRKRSQGNSRSVAKSSVSEAPTHNTVGYARVYLLG
jgi:hypothetical protein